MAVRQYIGARYVPKFSDVNDGVWDGSNSYEALTVVKYNNDYYTSKIPVPAGVAITNNIYWIKTGDYNGSINSLQTQIDSLNTELININTELININSEITNIYRLKSMYSGKRIVIFGDSLSSQALSDDWVTPFTALMNSIGASVTNKAVAGAQVLNMLTAAQNDTTPYDVAIIWVGINDVNNKITIGPFNTPDTFQNRYSELISTLYNHNANTKIFTFGLTYTQRLAFVKNSLYLYNQAIEELAVFKGYIFKTMIGLPNNGLGSNTATVDGTHFSESYSKTIIFNKIVNALINPVSESNPEINFTFNDRIVYNNATAVSVTSTINTKSGVYIDAVIDMTAGEVRPMVLDIIALPASTVYTTNLTDGTLLAINNNGAVALSEHSATRAVFNIHYIPSYLIKYQMSANPS